MLVTIVNMKFYGYAWNETSATDPQHMIAETGELFCRQNKPSEHIYNKVSAAKHPGRKICRKCNHRWHNGNKAPAKKRKKKKPKTARNKASAQFLRSVEWKTVRYKALKKYGPKCMCCGITPADGAVMNVDHIKPRHKYPELALDINNLQILCGSCNYGKYGADETDWREPSIRKLMGETI